MCPDKASSPPFRDMPDKSGLQARGFQAGDPPLPPALIHRFLETRQVRQLLETWLPEVLYIWAGDNPVKKKIARLAGRHWRGSLCRPQDPAGNKELQQLFEDPAVIEALAAHLPKLLNGFYEAADSSLAAMDSLSPEKKKAVWQALAAGIACGRTGNLLTRSAKMLNEIHQSDPEFFARALKPGFSRWVETMDFGEIREALENSAADVRAIVSMANNVIWQYPAKVVLILSMLPVAVNMMVDSLEISIEKLNSLSPDLLTDVACTFIRDLNGPALSRLVHELAEVVRKLHTGSALLGEAGHPQIYKSFSDKLTEIIDLADLAALGNALTMLHEIKDQFDLALFDTTARSTECLQQAFAQKTKLSNIRRGAINRRLEFLDTMDDEILSDALARTINGLDVQEAAETLNHMIRLYNRLQDSRPGAAAAFVRQFSDAIDVEELSCAARNIMEGSRQDLKPAARAVVPGLVSFVCEVLAPQEDEFEDAAACAREAMSHLYNAIKDDQ